MTAARADTTMTTHSLYSVATGAFFCDYEIPAELGALWKYIKEMYQQLDAFTQSNPADQDIINIYKQQQGVRSERH